MSGNTAAPLMVSLSNHGHTSRWACRRQPVEALGVVAKDGLLVRPGQLVALQQLLDIVLAAYIRHLMRVVRGIDEGLVANDLDGEGHRQLFRLAAKEEAAFLNLLDD